MLDALPFAAWPLGAQAGFYGFLGGLVLLLLVHVAVYSRQRMRERKAEKGQYAWQSIFPAGMPPGRGSRAPRRVFPMPFVPEEAPNRPLRRFAKPAKKRSRPVPRRWQVPAYRV
ncbi:hypothetical protein ACSHT0_02475 [Tepidicaulis sp. LMO-SS28]|uniref:hypothetical protein n=1 Tax=Tepidicaulis sp. LMO-SS28 TaxID=3447455 RepID=UPI003EE11CF9